MHTVEDILKYIHVSKFSSLTWKYSKIQLCLKWRSPFAPWREAHSGDGSIAMYLLGEGGFRKAGAMERLGQKGRTKVAERPSIFPTPNGA
ncbi:hypothetical protein F2Q68_00004066 [Brassica cretica]|uniref:Uncharacterized protein n=1 Tax=Brassica cretica TaxID=69181 RepID=A0A8S9J6Y4_BRACR|nr:hypothetical protein F2Q68_00004066 [Brassica cretica]